MDFITGTNGKPLEEASGQKTFTFPRMPSTSNAQQGDRPNPGPFPSGTLGHINDSGSKGKWPNSPSRVRCLARSSFGIDKRPSRSLKMPCREAKIIITSVLLILVSGSAASESRSAAERFQSLQAQLRKSHTSNDWHSNLASANELSELLNGAPNSLLEIARAEIHLGDLEPAIRNIEQFVRMGQSTDLLETSAEFAPVRKTRSFASVQSGMKANRSAIALGSTGLHAVRLETIGRGCGL